MQKFTKTFLTFIASIGFASLGIGQTCPGKIIATASPNPICVGGTAQLNVSGFGVLKDDFDPINTSQWNTITGVASSSCGSVSGNALYFDAIPRLATTNAINVTGGGSIIFDLKIGQGNSPCEMADSGEDVQLEYSIDGGISWVHISTYYTGTTYSNFTNIIVQIPSQAQTSSTMFKWSQPINSGQGFDNWSIDNVSITPNNNYTYAWTPSAGLSNASISNPVAVVKANTTYSVTVTNTALTCSTTANVTVTTAIAAQATISLLSGRNYICRGNSVYLSANTGLSYKWLLNGTYIPYAIYQNYSATTAGKYNVEVTYAGNCSSTSADLTLLDKSPAQPTITASGPTTICTGDNLILSSSAGYSYQWYNNGSYIYASSQKFTPTQSGSYSVSVSDSMQCSSTQSLPISVSISNPSVYASASSTSICTGGQTTLQSSVYPSGSYIYKWTPSTGLSSDSAANPTATVNATTTYTLTAKNKATLCSATSQVTISTFPVTQTTIRAYGDTVLCAGSNVQLYTSSYGNSYQWYLNGTAIQGQIYSYYYASAAGAYTVKVGYNGGCSITSSAINVQVSNSNVPVISASGPTSFCSGGSVTLTASAGSSYQWYNNSYTIYGANSQSYSATTTGMYSVRVSNAHGCYSTSVAVSVKSNGPSYVYAYANPSSICTTGTTQLYSNSDSITYSYYWSPTTGLSSAYSPNPKARIDSTITYTLKTTDRASGCSTQSKVTVFATSIPQAYTSRYTRCITDSVTIYANSGISYEWLVNDKLISGARNSFYNASTSGIFKVRVTYQGGCVSTSKGDTVKINATVKPTISASDTTFCAGDSVTLSASKGSSYQWYKDYNYIYGATGQKYTVRSSGRYTVSIIENSCYISSAPINITDKGPYIYASAKQYNICKGGSTQLSVYNRSAGNYTYTWSPTLGLSSPDSMSTAAKLDTTTSYTVFVKSARGGCSASSSVTIAVSKPTVPVITSGNTTICQGTRAVLYASYNGQNYQWNLNGTPLPGETSYYIYTSVSGSYTVTSSSYYNACPATSAPVTVTVIPVPVVNITAASPTFFCNGGSVTLSSNSVGSLQWYNNGYPISGQTTNTFIATQSGAYTLTVTSGSCRGTSSAINVSNYGPLVDLTASPSNLCAGGTTQLYANTSTYGSYSYSWSPSTGLSDSTVYNPVATISATTKYSVTVTNRGNGCSSTASTLVKLNSQTPAGITAKGPTTFCPGNSVLLTADLGLSYQWYRNGIAIAYATSQNYYAQQSGNYTVNVSFRGGCSSVSVALKVTVLPNPSAAIATTGTTFFCAGGSVTFNVPAGNTYQWYKDSTAIAGETTSSYKANASGTYTVRVSNNSGCSTVSRRLSVSNFGPEISAATSVATTCAGGSVNLTATVKGYDSYTYLWSPSVGLSDSTAASTNAVVKSKTTYSVLVSDIMNGCTATATVPVNVSASLAPAQPVITLHGTKLVTAYNAKIQWYLNNMAISGATDTAYTPSSYGNYTVSITTSQNCSSTSAVYSYFPTKIVSQEPVTTFGLSAYPNPFSENVVIKYTVQEQSLLSLEVTNALGELVLSAIKNKETAPGTYEFTMDEANKTLGSGMYFVKLKTNNKTANIKIFKSR